MEQIKKSIKEKIQLPFLAAFFASKLLGLAWVIKSGSALLMTHSTSIIKNIKVQATYS